jgi:hypothetical protein
MFTCADRKRSEGFIPKSGKQIPTVEPARARIVRLPQHESLNRRGIGSSFVRLAQTMQ